MNTQSIAKLLISVTLIIITILGDSLRHEVMAQGGISLRIPFNGTRKLTAYVDHRSPIYGNDTYSNIVVYNGEDRIPCVDCGQAWTTQGPTVTTVMTALTMRLVVERLFWLLLMGLLPL